MKIPHSVTGRTQPSSQGLGYFRDSSDLAIGPWKQAAGALAGLGSALQAQQDKDQGFDALMKYNEFETKYAEAETVLRRSVDPADTSYLQRSEATFDNLSSKFISSLPPALQKEYQARISGLKQRAAGNSLAFNYEQKDGWYRQGIGEAYAKSRNIVNDDPESLDEELARINETIDKSDLSEGEKQSLKASTGEQLLLDSYRSTMLKEGVKAEPGKSTSGPAFENGKLKKSYKERLAQIESGGNPNARNPSGADGIYQIMPQTAKQYGVTNTRDAAQNDAFIERFTADNAAYLRKQLGREPTEGELYLAHQQGAGGASKLLANPGARAVDVVGYQAVVQNGGAPNMSAAQFASKWINKFDGTTGVSIDDDPRYAGIPLEKRLAIKNDVEQQQRAEYAESERMRKDQQDAFDESLKVAAHQKKLSSLDALQLLDEGKIDSSTYSQLQTIFKSNKEAVDKYAEAVTDMGAGKALSDAQHSTVFEEEDGAGKLAAMDQKYVETILPRALQQGDVPTGLMSQLGMMMKSDDPRKAAFAYDTLSRLQQASLPAFTRRADEATERDIAAFDVLRKTRSDSEVISLLSGGKTLEEKQARIRFKDDAKKLYSDQAFGTTAAAASLEDLLDFKILGSGTLPNIVGAEGAFHEWYQTNWEEFFVKANGDQDAATEMTNEYAKKVWSITEIGSRGGKLMMNTPENSGLPMYEGKFDWIEEQVRDKENISPDWTFELIADAKTAKEIRDYKAGKGPPPSWMIMKFDGAGIPYIENKRVTIEPEPERVVRDYELKGLQDLEDKLNIFMEDTYQPEHETARGQGRPPNPVVEEARQALEEMVNKERERLNPKKAPKMVPTDRRGVSQ
jgi:hypothetical protein